MKETFHLLIQTPDSTLFNGEANSLAIETENGQLEILPHHAHLISTVVFASPRVRVGVTDMMFAVRNGSVYFDTENNTCRVLVSWGQKREEIVHESIVQYLAFVEEKLANKESLNMFQLKYLNDQKQSLDEMIRVTVTEK